MDRVHQNKPYQLSSPQLDPRVDICYTTLKYIIAAQSRAGSFKKKKLMHSCVEHGYLFVQGES